MKKNLAVVSAVLAAAVLCLSGCGNTKTATKAQTAAVPEEETAMSETALEKSAVEGSSAEEGETGSAAKAAGKHDTVILVVSFGTSYNESRDAAIGAIEKAIADTYPQYEVRRAFTSQTIIDKLKERDGLEIDNVTDALDRAAADGVKKLIVQPTHLMDGLEYMDLVAELKEYEEDFDQISVGDPLLTNEADFEAVVKAVTEATKSYDDGTTAVIFMGHGTEAESNQVYKKLQDVLKKEGFDHYYIGTVEAKPSLEEVAESMKEVGIYEKAVLEPLMVVAGDHASNDMAGDEEDSWRTVLSGEGYEVECILRGLGELEDIQKIYIDHVQAALDRLTES